MTIQEEIELFEVLNNLLITANPVRRWFLKRRYKTLQKKYLNHKTTIDRMENYECNI